MCYDCLAETEIVVCWNRKCRPLGAESLLNPSQDGGFLLVALVYFSLWFEKDWVERIWLEVGVRADVRVQAARNRNRKPSKQGCRTARQGAGSDKSEAETLMGFQENGVAFDFGTNAVVEQDQRGGGRRKT